MPRRSIAILLLVGASCSPDVSSTSESSTDADSDSSDAETGASLDWERVVQADVDVGALMSVWGPNPSEVYAVGGQLDPSFGTVLRFDGRTWESEPLPADTAMLNWVFGIEGRVWAVGRDGSIVTREDEAWTAELSPTDRVLWGVWGASADELWAVGGDGVGDSPMILRRDGATEIWELVVVPDLSVATNGLFKVWGSAADDVWIVGDTGASLHFDGAMWTDHSTEDNVDLISLWGTPAEGTVAVGGRASGRVVRLVDGAWAGETLEYPGLNGVWVDPMGPITIVGNMGTILDLGPGGFEVTPVDSGTVLVLHAVFGFAGGPRFAVGGSLLSPPPYTGVVLESD